MNRTSALFSKSKATAKIAVTAFLLALSGTALAQTDPDPPSQTQPADADPTTAPANDPAAPADPAPAIDPMVAARTATVEVLVQDGGNVAYRHSGVIIAPQTVLTTALSIRGADSVEIVTEGGARYAAEAMSSIGRNQVLAVLYVAGLNDAPARLAANPAEKDLIAHLIYRADGATITETGAVGTYSGANSFSHFALAPTRGLGGALFNDCGEIVGLSRPESGFARRSFRREASLESPRTAASLAEIVDAMNEESLQPGIAAETCVSEAEKAKRRAEERAEEAEERAEELETLQREKEAEADAANEQLEALKRDQTATEAELQEAQRKADAARQDAETAKRETDEAREELSTLEADLEEAEQDLADAEKELDESNERVETLEQANEEKDSTIEEQENQILLIAAIGGGIALLAIIVGLLVARHRKKKQVAAEQAAIVAAEKADQVGAEVERLRNVPKAIPPYANCLLEGDQRNLSLPGELLPEEAGGVVIGRHPANAKAVLESDRVSRRHARIFVRDNIVYIEDLGSTNGTFLNGNKLAEGEPVQVNPGDEVGIDKMRFAFRKI